MQPTDETYGRIVLFQHEVFETCMKIYKKDLVPPKELEVMHEVSRRCEILLTRLLINDKSNKRELKRIRTAAIELAALTSILVAEHLSVVTSDQEVSDGEC